MLFSEDASSNLAHFAEWLDRPVVPAGPDVQDAQVLLGGKCVLVLPSEGFPLNQERLAIERLDLIDVSSSPA